MARTLVHLKKGLVGLSMLGLCVIGQDDLQRVTVPPSCRVVDKAYDWQRRPCPVPRTCLCTAEGGGIFSYGTWLAVLRTPMTCDNTLVSNPVPFLKRGGDSQP
jgi:hypothetical protein